MLLDPQADIFAVQDVRLLYFCKTLPVDKMLHMKKYTTEMNQ